MHDASTFLYMYAVTHACTCTRTQTNATVKITTHTSNFYKEKHNLTYINYEQNHAYFASQRDTNQRVINNAK